MGVTEFQKVIENFGKEQKISSFRHAIIDGNNLLMIRIPSTVSTLAKQFYLQEFDGYSIDVCEQLVRIIKQVGKGIISTFHTLLSTYHMETIYVIFDPKTTPLYRFRSDMIFCDEDTTLEESEYCDFLLNGVEEVAIKLKQDEQNKRTAAQSSDSKFEQLYKNIDNITVTDSVKELFKNIAKQSHYFHAVEGWKKIIQPCIDYTLYLLSEDEEIREHVKFYDSEVEADLSIKNLALKLTAESPDNILILSTDTDYYILFADCPNVYCKSLNGKPPAIYSPMQVFKRMLGKEYKYDIVIRLAPLLGNDYTVHAKIGSSKDIDNVLKLFGINGKIEDLRSLRKNTTVYKMIANASNVDTMNTMTKVKKYHYSFVDKLIRNHDEATFRGYLMSVLTYKNIEYYADKITIREYSKESLNNTFKNLQKHINETFDSTLYTWAYVGSIHDKHFISSIAEIKFDFEDEHSLLKLIIEAEEEPQIRVEDMPEIESD